MMISAAHRAKSRALHSGGLAVSGIVCLDCFLFGAWPHRLRLGQGGVSPGNHGVSGADVLGAVFVVDHADGVLQCFQQLGAQGAEIDAHG